MSGTKLTVMNRGLSKLVIEWEGRVDDFGLPQGPGLVECSDGCKYSGEWDTAVFPRGIVVPWINGVGVIMYKDGASYEGFLESSSSPDKLLGRYGQGVYTDPEGNKEEGWWYNDKLVNPKR